MRDTAAIMDRMDGPEADDEDLLAVAAGERVLADLVMGWALVLVRAELAEDRWGITRATSALDDLLGRFP